jgi:hypothetical protein
MHDVLDVYVFSENTQGFFRMKSLHRKVHTLHMLHEERPWFAAS